MTRVQYSGIDLGKAQYYRKRKQEVGTGIEYELNMLLDMAGVVLIRKTAYRLLPLVTNDNWKWTTDFKTIDEQTTW